MKLSVAGTLALCLALAPFSARAQSEKKPELAELLALTDRWLVVHVVDGHVVHHGKGEKGAAERAIVTRIDATRADKPGTWSILSPDDPADKAGKAPLRVARR